MRPRIFIAKKIISLGSFVQSLAVSIMKPDDLTEFGRMSYSKPSSINEWSGETVVQAGLSHEETELIKRIPFKKGKMLLLGIGGGREAVHFAKMGFDITGVDFIPEMIENAKKNLKKEGFAIKGIVGDFPDLKLEQNHFDLVWLSKSMYSSIPTKRRRLLMNKRIFNCLKPGCYFLCQFHWSEKGKKFSISALARKFIALITFGNFRLQRGDKLWFNIEFVHFFTSENELSEEFKESGFIIKDFHISGSSNGEIVLIKPGSQNI